MQSVIPMAIALAAISLAALSATLLNHQPKGDAR